MLFALGLGDQVVAVTHECDWPPAAASLPHLTRTVVPAGLSAAEIDRTVRETVGAGRPLYELDRERLARARPRADRDPGGVRRVRGLLRRRGRGRGDAAEQAARDLARPADARRGARRRRAGWATPPRPTAESRLLREQARRRIEAVEQAVAGAPRPRVAAIEWLDPPFVARALGAGDDRASPAARTCSARPASGRARPSGRRSRRRTGRRARDAVRLRRSAIGRGGESSSREPLARLGAQRTVAVDASAYFSRPGPRLVTGIELLGPSAASRSRAGAGGGRARRARQDRCGRRDLNPHRQEPTSS